MSFVLFYFVIFCLFFVLSFCKQNISRDLIQFWGTFCGSACFAINVGEKKTSTSIRPHVEDAVFYVLLYIRPLARLPAATRRKPPCITTALIIIDSANIYYT